jgi:hypothetical protein
MYRRPLAFASPDFRADVFGVLKWLIAERFARPWLDFPRYRVDNDLLASDSTTNEDSLNLPPDALALLMFLVRDENGLSRHDALMVASTPRRFVPTRCPNPVWLSTELARVFLAARASMPEGLARHARLDGH